jgi:hypothetical protein
MSIIRRLLPRHSSHPDQAGFRRRGLAVAVDLLLVTLLSVLAWFFADGLAVRHAPSAAARLAAAHRAGRSISVLLGRDKQKDLEVRPLYLRVLSERLPKDALIEAALMELPELVEAHSATVEAADPKAPVYICAGESFSLLQEFLIGYLYCILFFRWGGRTPGKLLFGLRVVDRGGRAHLGWYQAFERTHGYAASMLSGFLGFLQVLWDHEGLTMHDRLSETTVVRVRRSSGRAAKVPAAPQPDAELTSAAEPGEAEGGDASPQPEPVSAVDPGQAPGR